MLSCATPAPAPAPRPPGPPGAAPRRRRPGRDPGRVDSPPTSTMSAPWASQLAAVGHRGVAVEPLAPVGERVGRDVEHAHDAPAGHWRIVGACSAVGTRAAARRRSGAERHDERRPGALVGAAEVGPLGVELRAVRAAQPRGVVLEAVLEDEQPRDGRRVVAQAEAVVVGLGRRRERAADDPDLALAELDLADRDLRCRRRCVPRRCRWCPRSCRPQRPRVGL